MEKEFGGSKAFLMIPPSISRDKELLKKPKSILLMGEIISMLNVTGDFHMSNKTLADILDATPKSVNDWLNLLEKKGLIVREQITIPAQNPKNEKSKRILGRTIKAGPNLVTLSLLGWSRTGSKGDNADVSRVVTPTSHKKIRDNRTTNRTVNKSSSSSFSLEDQSNSIKNQKSEEEDKLNNSNSRKEEPRREKVYKRLFQIARMNDQWKGTRTIPTPDQIRQLRMLLYQCDYLSLDAVLQTFSEKMRADQLFEPWKYVLQLMRDKIAAQKNYESWG